MIASARPWRWMWRSSWQRASEGAASRVQITGLAWLLLFGGIGYGTVARVAPYTRLIDWTPSTPWDRAIPAHAWTILVYLTYYVPFALCAVVSRRTGVMGRRQFVLLLQSLHLTLAISFAIFLLLPCHVDGRELLIDGANSFWLPVVRAVHVMDLPVNAWPSLHVSLSFLQCCWLSERVRSLSRLLLCWFWWVLMCVSVLTTKQHYLFDVLTGTALGALMWLGYLKPASKRVRRDPEAFDAELAG
ncbi:MAG: membrane-associated phospholipid phosphatase [Planctomycetota bacterium]|jgi:membrane-associated phospholipid phosphatase